MGHVLGVPAARGSAFTHEALEGRQRLRDRETALLGRKLLAEDGLRGMEAAAWTVGEGGLDHVQALAVVLDDLARPRRRMVDRLAVSGGEDAQGARGGLLAARPVGG